MLTFLASTSLGQRFAIKPAITIKIKEGHHEIDALSATLKDVTLLKQVPALEKALHDLASEAHSVINALLQEKHLDTIVGIVGNHIGKYSSIKEFKTAVFEKEAFKELQGFALKLIDVNHYQHLVTLLKQLQTFDQLSKSQKKELWDTLQDNSLLENIKQEQKSLDVEQLNRDIQSMSKKLCVELNLSAQESQRVIALFESLTKEHLPRLNSIRKIIVDNLEPYFTLEKARLLEKNPELKPKAQGKRKESPIVHQYNAKAIKNAASTVSAAEPEKKKRKKVSRKV